MVPSWKVFSGIDELRAPLMPIGGRDSECEYTCACACKYMQIRKSRERNCTQEKFHAATVALKAPTNTYWLPNSAMHCLPTRNKERLVVQRLELTQGWPGDCARRMEKQCDAHRAATGLWLAENKSRFAMGRRRLDRISRHPSSTRGHAWVSWTPLACIPTLAVTLSLINFRTHGLNTGCARSHFRTRTTDYWSIPKLCI